MATPPTPNPRVLISYSHDSEDHKAVVLRFAEDLQRRWSLKVVLDQWEPHPEVTWSRWMDEEVVSAEYVISVCTATYRLRTEGRAPSGTGAGATREGALINQAIYEANGRNKKFIAVLLPGASDDDIPTFLRGYTYYRMPDAAEELARFLHKTPKLIPPPLAPTPPFGRDVAGPTPGPQPLIVMDDVPEPTDSGSQASLLVGLAEPVREPTRVVHVWPFSAPERLLLKRDALAIVQAAALPLRAAELLMLPSVAQHPLFDERGLLWRANGPTNAAIDYALAVGSDGSVSFVTTLWEPHHPGLAGADQAIGIGTCLDVVLGSLAFAQRIVSRTGRRPHFWFTTRVLGAEGRRFMPDGTDGAANPHVPGGWSPRLTKNVVQAGGQISIDTDLGACGDSFHHLLSNLTYTSGWTASRAYVQERLNERARHLKEAATRP